MFPITSKLKLRAFTIAELLIALSVLSIIATFNITKILEANQLTAKKAIFQDDISNLNTVLYTGILDGTIQSGADFNSAVSVKLNAIKYCPNNGTTEGCWNTSQNNASVIGETTQGGVLLSNGSSVVGFSATGDADAFVIDWNGIQGPNNYGDDQIKLVDCYYTGPDCGGWSNASYTGKISPGTISPAQGSTDLILWNWIFAH